MFKTKIFFFSFLILYSLTSCQVTILGPPSVVNKVKELEDGSKHLFIFLYYK